MDAHQGSCLPETNPLLLVTPKQLEAITLRLSAPRGVLPLSEMKELLKKSEPTLLQLMNDGLARIEKAGFPTAQLRERLQLKATNETRAVRLKAA